MTTNAIVPANNSRTHLGDRNAIAAVHSRLASMMQLPADVPAEVVWAAAQIAAAHHLDPFVGELYIMPTGAKKNEVTGAWEQQYRAHVGVKGLRKIAREQANFTAKLTVMEPDEVQRYRRDMYHPDDVGVRCTLWRLDVARECKDAGVPYEPVVGVGFWRVKAQWHSSKKEWMPDNVPNTWTAQQVAEKRAEINAIKLGYDLVLDVADPSTIDVDAMEYVEYKVRSQDEDTSIPVSHQLQVEDDGDILYEAEPAPQPRAAPPVQPGVDGDVIFDRNAPWYADARRNLAAAYRQVADDMLTLHRNNGGPARAKAYGYLCGLIDNIVEQATGAEDGHKRVLAVLCQMDVTQENRPSATMTGRLLAKLATHIKDQATQQKVANPDYDEDTAAAMVAIYRAAEAVGTPSLLEAA